MLDTASHNFSEDNDMCGLKDYHVCAKTYFTILSIDTCTLRFLAGLWGIPAWTDMGQSPPSRQVHPCQAQDPMSGPCLKPLTSFLEI